VPPLPRLTLSEPPVGTAVAVYGYSLHTPVPGVQPDTLLLQVAGPSAGFLRLRGDEVKDGFSGGMVVRLDEGTVCGVLKGSRDFEGVRGGWCTPMAALRTALSPDDPLRQLLGGASTGAGPSDLALVEALEALSDMDDPDFRRRLLRIAADRLGPEAPLRVPYRAQLRDHVVEMVQVCRGHRDAAAALASLAHAARLLRPGESATERLWQLAGAVENGLW
jgi:hypothetical protein